MTADRKTPARIPCIVAAICLAIVLIVVVFSLAGGGAGPAAGPSPASCSCPCETRTAGPAIPAAITAPCPSVIRPVAGSGPALPETLASADLVLERPAAGELVPYTERGFSLPAEAAIAWWMSPGFMDNTSEFRTYLRRTAAEQAAYPEEHRVFFRFIQAGLDEAEQQSVLKSDLVLFRGIGGGFAATVLDNAEYRERAYASTSYDISLSLDEFGPRSQDGFRNVLVLGRHPGNHALYVNEDQREFLLPRNTTWHVVKAVNVANLTVEADFPLHGRNETVASFDHVRLIYIRETSCT